MSKPKHTPGPWKVMYDLRQPKGRTALVETEQVLVAHDLSDANARLIAAAPEMLGQLKLVQAYLKEKNLVFTGIDAAIAKAEGKE